MKAAKGNANKITYRPDSSLHRGRSQSYFECWALTVFPNHEYSKFLLRIKDCDDSNAGKLTLVTPNDDMLLAYVYHLRDDKDTCAGDDNDDEDDESDETAEIRGRRNKYNWILQHLKKISGVLKEHGQPLLIHSSEITKCLDKWNEEDKTRRAEVYLVEEVLPKLWKQLWGNEDRNEKQKTELWSRLLGQLATISRSSDVTGQYCPTIDGVKFPQNEKDYFDDGLPVWIELTWVDWKGRPKKHKKSPYKVRLHANPLDARYCPVHWMIKHWCDRGNDLDPSEPVYKKLSSKVHQKHVSNLFDELDLDGSSHSVRRMAAQWAARCKADINVIKNVGRWSSLDHLVVYLDEGLQTHATRVLDSADGVDPISKFWVFNHGTAVSSMSTRAARLNALAVAC
jgi:hypothetical protein